MSLPAPTCSYSRSVLAQHHAAHIVPDVSVMPAGGLESVMYHLTATHLNTAQNLTSSPTYTPCQLLVRNICSLVKPTAQSLQAFLCSTFTKRSDAWGKKMQVGI